MASARSASVAGSSGRASGDGREASKTGVEQIGQIHVEGQQAAGGALDDEKQRQGEANPTMQKDEGSSYHRRVSLIAGAVAAPASRLDRRRRRLNIWR